MDSHATTIQTDTNETLRLEKNTNDPKHAKGGEQKESPQHYTEATINFDDVIRAGGFGARDGLSSAFPIASDSTDFESSLLDMREYEEPQGETRRPGLGWTQDKESE